VTPLVEELVPPPDPVRACEQLAGLPHRIFLDSAARGSRLGRYSFLSADPVAIVREDGAAVAAGAPVPSGFSRTIDAGDPLEIVRRLLAPYRCTPIAGLPPFQGGAAGYVSYDWSRALERVPPPRHEDLPLARVAFGIYDWVLAWDHESRRAWLISTGIGGVDPAARATAVRTRLHAGDSPYLPAGCPLPAAGVSSHAPSHAVDRLWWDSPVALRSSFTRQGYLDAVARVREYILAGDIFQANLSQRFETPLVEAPWAIYRRLRTRNAAPFAAFIDFPEVTILSASPERFLRVDDAGGVETRPIKGTRPRGLGPEHDAALGQALTESDKDRAENLMIVDLMRNDLSRVCAPGTVKVPELFAVERYATVHHLVSTVVGTLAPGVDALALLRAAFPPGSITGAPKVRAMEIIAELEPSQRGVYCGTIGYWSVTGALDTSVAIRTAMATGGRICFGAGGGIIADSDPDAEYRETLDKARGIIDALQP
jgi:para-aminobenzoate synthetase component 1